MLTRLYIDNFRCFVDFGCYFGNSNKQLIIGRNGSGKTFLFEVLLYLRQFAIASKIDASLLAQQTHWLRQSQQTFEIEASLHNASYIYRLVIDPEGIETQPLIRSETVHCNRKPIFEFIDGQVHLYDDLFQPGVVYPFDRYRSAFATISEKSGNTELIKFKNWFSRLACFKLNPFANTAPVVRSQQAFPETDLSNFADWYWHLERAYPAKRSALFEDLSAAIDNRRCGRQHEDLLDFPSLSY